MDKQLYFVAKQTGELYGHKDKSGGPAEWLDGDEGLPISMTMAVAQYLFGSHLSEYVLVKAER